MAKKLHSSIEEKAKLKGIKKLIAVVERSNAVAVSFFNCMGYTLKEIQNLEIILEKEIIIN
ncbi:MAG: GNAT family N-acetyltransferase [Candidatus Diapherotrites archaeon]|nr:GNAT family N-acetyltransferase [Candidatus Diapherotrites archaeon]